MVRSALCSRPRWSGLAVALLLGIGLADDAAAAPAAAARRRAARWPTHGLDARAAADDGARRGGRPRARVRTMQEAAAPQEHGAARVRGHRVARAAHAADVAAGDARAARGGAARRRAGPRGRAQAGRGGPDQPRGWPGWPTELLDLAASTPASSCAASRWSWASSCRAVRRSSRGAPATAASSSRSPPPTARVGHGRPQRGGAHRAHPDRQRPALLAGGRAISSAIECQGDRRACRVADAGPGVPAGERELIFERFKRGSAPAERPASASASRSGGSWPSGWAARWT